MPSSIKNSITNLFVATQAFARFNDEDEHGAIGNASLVGNNLTSDGRTRYKVLGLSEGIHNGLRVLREDIKQMADDVMRSTDTIPVVLDHSFAWNDVVGKVIDVTYYDSYVAPDGKQLNGALLMDIELLPPSETTPKLNETIYRLEQLPELAKFSVAFKFTPITDENGNITVHDLVLKHLAIVTNPADSSTQILEKLSKRENVEYMSFDLNDMENVINRGNQMPTTKRHTARYAARRNARFNNPVVDAIARDPLTRGTYPIADVRAITMAPGQRSPLACGCGDELYERQNNAQFARRRAARFAAARRNARFGARRPSARRARFSARRPTARFTQYGVPTIYGNPWEYPVSDMYPNVNQLIALRRKQAALRRNARFGRRASLLEQRDAAKFGRRSAARFSARRNARFGARRNARFGGRRYARFDDEIAPISDAFTPVVEAPVVGPAFEVPENTAVIGNVSEYVSQDIIPTADPVVQAYVDAGLIVPEEIPVVETALRQHRAARFAARRHARFGRRSSARFGARRPVARRARFATRRPTARRSAARFAATRRNARFGARRPVARRARFAARRPTAGRRARFEGLINEYMVPSANLPRAQNVNIRDAPAQSAAFARRRAARFGARSPRRSGSFFADGGVKRASKMSKAGHAVPTQVTSIAPTNSANSAPATFVGKQDTNALLKELSDTKNKLADAEKLSVLRSQALSMQFADKDLIMTFTEDQLKKYIESKGNQHAAFAGQMNPFVGNRQNDQQKAQYICEFADSFTKGNYNTVATIDQISQSSEAKAKQIFGGN